jgi:cyclase
MSISRKEFLKACTLAAGGIILKSSNILGQLQEKQDGFITLRNNFGIYVERGGTIAWLTPGDAVVVVDSQFPDTAKNFVASLQKVTSRKIDLLFNTHHHGDHTSGNVYLKDYTAKIVAHENCVELQKKNSGNDPSKPIVWADTTFKDEWSATFGKEKITAKYFGPAHTGGDSVIHFENSNIAHMGDLVFNRTYPYLDSGGGGSVVNWINVLEKAIKYYSKDTLFIFGHGITNEFVTGYMQDLSAMKDFISALVDFISNEIKKGSTKEQIVLADGIPGFKDLKEMRAGMKKMNLEKAYDELIKNKN